MPRLASTPPSITVARQPKRPTRMLHRGPVGGAGRGGVSGQPAGEASQREGEGRPGRGSSRNEPGGLKGVNPGARGPAS